MNVKELLESLEACAITGDAAPTFVIQGAIDRIRASNALLARAHTCLSFDIGDATARKVAADIERFAFTSEVP